MREMGMWSVTRNECSVLVASFLALLVTDVLSSVGKTLKWPRLVYGFEIHSEMGLDRTFPVGPGRTSQVGPTSNSLN